MIKSNNKIETARQIIHMDASGMDDVRRDSAHKSIPIAKRPKGAYIVVMEGFSPVRELILSTGR